MSFCRGTDKLGYIKTTGYSALKGNEPSSHEKAGRTSSVYDQVEEANGNRLYGPNSMTPWKRQKYRDSKTSSGCRGVGVGLE